MTPQPERRVVVLGYGNPGRHDDGLGPALASAVEALHLPEVAVEEAYQLNIEDGATLADCDAALFVDASMAGAAPFEFRPVAAARSIAFTSHAVDPGSVLAICEEHFSTTPDAWVLAIRGYDFSMGEGLSDSAQQNLAEAVTFTRALLARWRNDGMESNTRHKKTVLTIDDDADIRAALRVVLQAEGFSVGEASSGEEGLQIALDIQPDAILVDLMMEKVDSGQRVARELRDAGYTNPIYMLSSAGDTVRYNIDARALGLSGIFQKPINPKKLADTLKAKLERA